MYDTLPCLTAQVALHSSSSRTAGTSADECTSTVATAVEEKRGDLPHPQFGCSEVLPYRTLSKRWEASFRIAATRKYQKKSYQYAKTSSLRTFAIADWLKRSTPPNTRNSNKKCLLLTLATLPRAGLTPPGVRRTPAREAHQPPHDRDGPRQPDQEEAKTQTRTARPDARDGPSDPSAACSHAPRQGASPLGHRAWEGSGTHRRGQQRCGPDTGSGDPLRRGDAVLPPGR